MLRGSRHALSAANTDDLIDHLVGVRLEEQIRHRVDEDPARLPPMQRVSQGRRQLEADLVQIANAIEMTIAAESVPLFRVAVRAARRDLHAEPAAATILDVVSRDRVP
jgi:tRNA(Ser,Leu) C12 N-acetylase TAN1